MALKAYITNVGDGTVSVIDVATNTVLIPPVVVGGNPNAVAINAAGTKVYVTNGTSLNIIDTCSNVVTTIVVGTQLRGVAVSKDDTRIYVTNGSTDTVIVINAATNTILTTIPVGDSPQGVVVSNDNTRVYVTNNGNFVIGNSVSVIDNTLAIPVVIDTVPDLPPSSFPGGIDITPDDAFLYIGNSGAGLGNTVSVVETATNTLFATVIISGLQVNPLGIVVTPDGQFVYVSNTAANSVSVIEVSSNTLFATIAGFPSGTFGLSITPDGSFVYTANLGDNSVSVIDTSSNTIVGFPIPVGTSPIAFGKFIGDVPPCPPTPPTPKKRGRSIAASVLGICLRPYQYPQGRPNSFIYEETLYSFIGSFNDLWCYAPMGYKGWPTHWITLG